MRTLQWQSLIHSGKQLSYLHGGKRIARLDRFLAGALHELFLQNIRQTCRYKFIIARNIVEEGVEIDVMQNKRHRRYLKRQSSELAYIEPDRIERLHQLAQAIILRRSCVENKGYKQLL